MLDQTHQPRVLHLVDDTTPGGVMRVLNCLLNSEVLSEVAQHSLLHVPRNLRKLPRLEADVIVSHLSLDWANFMARSALRAQYPHVPMVHVEHGYTASYVARNIDNKPRFLSMLRTGFSLFDKVIAVSQDQGEWFLQRRLCPPEKLRVIRSCVDLEAFAHLTPPSAAPRVFGIVGRLAEQKGVDIAIDAVVNCASADIRLEIHGQGDLDQMLMARAGKDPRITFHGHSDDPCAPFERIDALLVPSRWEAYGLVALEARIAGRPVIAADIDGLKDHATDGLGKVHLVPNCANWAATLERLSNRICRDTASEHGRFARAEEARRLKQAFERDWCALLRDLTLEMPVIHAVI